LDFEPAIADQSGLRHVGDRDRAGEALVELPDVHDLDFGEVRIEADLGHTALERILAAFEVSGNAATLARGLALAAATGGLAEAGAFAATLLEALLHGALGGAELIELHLASSTFTRWATTRTMPS